MTRAELDAFLAARNLKVDGVHSPHSSEVNKFSDLYIGMGLPYGKLDALRKELQNKLHPLEVKVSRVDNRDHDDYGKMFVEIKSFWNS